MCTTLFAEWSHYVLWGEYAWNSLFHTPLTSSLSSMSWVFSLFSSPGTLSPVTPLVKNRYWGSHCIRVHTHSLLLQQSATQKVRVDRRCRSGLSFCTGDRVCISTQNIWLPVVSKIGPKYISPFWVLWRLGPVMYHLQLF